MRIVSYNILDGGQGRADPLAEVLASRRPDVACLIEADHEPTLRRITDRLNMDVVIGQGGRHCVALLSRWPIAWSVDRAALSGGDAWSFLCAEIEMPGHAPIGIGVVHLSPKATDDQERQREAEVASVLAAFEADRRAGRAHVLAGDFNANAPRQRIDPARCKESTRRAFEANGGSIPRRAIARLETAGYVDTLRAADSTLADSTGSFTTQYPGQRVDYIFAWAPKRPDVRAAWIEQDRLAKYASDHYPVGAELEFGERVAAMEAS
jgi:endonuclease/exonuclease/phosphatase family metal-dependent hydrolase